MAEDLMLVILLTILIHMIDTFSYAVRLAGVLTNKLAVALSLFNILVLVSRTSNLIQGPLAGSFIDHARLTGDTIWVEEQFRFIIFSATIGSILGAILIPTFIRIFSRAIMHLEVEGSIPHLLRRTLTISKMGKIKHHLRAPRLDIIHKLRIAGIPKRLIILQIFITAIYTVGVLSAMYASLLVPEHATRALMSSGLINGVATILLSIFVDPQVALLTDQVLNGRKKYQTILSMVGVLVIGKIIGTLLGQVLFIPSAEIISLFATWVS